VTINFTTKQRIQYAPVCTIRFSFSFRINVNAFHHSPFKSTCVSLVCDASSSFQNQKSFTERKVEETLTQGTSTDVEWVVVYNISFVQNGYIIWKQPVITLHFFLHLSVSSQFPHDMYTIMKKLRTLPCLCTLPYDNPLFWTRFLGDFHIERNKLSRLCESCGFHSGVVEDPVLLGHEAAWLGNRIQTFRGSTLPSSSTV
jgi:hypothetical protein